MMSKEKRWVVCTLAPLLVHPLPIIQSPQLFCPMVDTMSVLDLTSAMIAGAINVTIRGNPRQPPPHPQQGGCRITAKYLRELEDTEARWVFRCVFPAR